MRLPGFDPAPRSYPPSVFPLRRVTGRPHGDPETTTVEDIAKWLFDEALSHDDLLPLYQSFVWRLVAAGIPLDRASLHVGTLHPQMFGFAWNWNRADGFCDEVKVAEAALKTDAYRRNPLYRVIEHGEVFRGRTDRAELVNRFPLIADLAAQGITEYAASPLSSGGTYHNAATTATKQTGGFSESQLADLDRLHKLFALHVERHIALRISANVLDTYLGSAAGAHVLNGSIKRGAGEPIRAVIWASDLRGFTDLANRISGSEMIALLNEYFERLAAAVMDLDGEVLKFIGDGLLAVFPFAAFRDEKAAAAASLVAAERGLAAIDLLNADPPSELAAIAGWRPLRTGIALHEGEVFFGNVGAPERLDFTVIGRAVNTASRVEALSKSTGRSILLTEQVARHIDRKLDALGEYELRGLSEPIAIFSPAQ